MKTTVTRHGDQRLKGRAGIKRSAHPAVAKRAFEQGLSMDEIAGRLYEWTANQYSKRSNAREMRLYDYRLFIFSEGTALVTVLDLPGDLRGNFEMAMRKKKAAPKGVVTTVSKEEKEKEPMSELQLIKSKNFGAIQCDFYQGENDYYMTREQIGQALEYADPSKAIDNIHARHADRLAKYSVTLKLRATDGKSYDTTVYNRKGVMEICRWSQQPKADEFMDFVWNTIDDLYTGKNQKAMSPAEFALLQAQAMVAIERKQNEQQAAIEAVNHRVDTIGEIISLNPNDWRRECRDMLSKIAYSLGDIKYMRELQQEVYHLMDDRFGVRLSVRLTNMKRVAAENGMCKSKRDKLNYLDVIGDDKKLIEAYVMIVKELSIKHGLDKGA